MFQNFDRKRNENAGHGIQTFFLEYNSISFDKWRYSRGVTILTAFRLIRNAIPSHSGNSVSESSDFAFFAGLAAFDGSRIIVLT